MRFEFGDLGAHASARTSAIAPTDEGVLSAETLGERRGIRWRFLLAQGVVPVAAKLAG